MAFLYEQFFEDIGESPEEDSRGYIQMFCPICQGSGKYLGYTPERDFFYCWKCHESHSKYSIIKAMGIKDVGQYFDERIHIPTIHEKIRGDLYKKPLEVVDNVGQNMIQFLKSRRYDSSRVYEAYGVRQFSHNFGNWRNHLYIPIRFKGVVVSHVVRNMDKESLYRYSTCHPKYEALPIKHTLYNYDNASQDVILVEGCFDVWRLGNYAVGSYGASVEDEQIRLLSTFRSVTVMFDQMAEGEARKVAYKLAPYTKVCSVDCPKSDPDSMTDDEAREFIKSWKKQIKELIR